MIRPLQSTLPIAKSLLPTAELPIGVGFVGAPDFADALDLMPAGNRSDLKPQHDATTGQPAGDHNGGVGGEVRYGKPDRHELSDKHTIDDDAVPKDPLRDAFRDFVGQTLFGQMLSSMRSTVGKPAYFHGGRAEEIFSEQLDRVMVERITEASAGSVADPMFELFIMQRSR
jgi:hypothetical protein